MLKFYLLSQKVVTNSHVHSNLPFPCLDIRTQVSWILGLGILVPQNPEDRGYLILGFNILNLFSNIATNISKLFTYKVKSQKNSRIFVWHFGGGLTPWRPRPLSDLPVWSSKPNWTTIPFQFKFSTISGLKYPES